MRTNRFSAILRTLSEHGPMSPRQIAEKMGINWRCLYGQANYMKCLVNEELVHVLMWDRQEGHGGPPIPIYAAGPGRNARRPKPLKELKLQNKYPPAVSPTIGYLLGIMQ